MGSDKETKANASAETAASGRVIVRLAEAGLEARADVADGLAETEEHLKKALAAAGVTYGIDRYAFADLVTLLADPSFSADNILIAEGTPAKEGVDGTLEVFFSLDLLPGRVREDGSLDYRERSFMHPVRKGERLARYTRPTPGVAGKTVKGEVLTPGEPQDPIISLGPGATMDEHGTIGASREGVILYTEGEQIDVVDHFEHRGDIDLETGNVDIIGSFTLVGNMCPDSRVHATGDIVISGMLDGGVVSADGSITIGGGAIGGEGGAVKANGDVACKHAQDITIKSGATLNVVRSATNCKLFAKQIKVGDGRGKLMGSEAYAEELILTGDAGALAGTPTLLVVAQPLQQPNLTATTIDRTRKRGRGKQRRARTKRAKDLRAITAQTRAAIEEKLRLRQQEHRMLDNAKIIVNGTAHVGVVVMFGTNKLVVYDSPRRVVFKFMAEMNPNIVMEKGT